MRIQRDLQVEAGPHDGKYSRPVKPGLCSWNSNIRLQLQASTFCGSGSYSKIYEFWLRLWNDLVHWRL